MTDLQREVSLGSTAPAAGWYPDPAESGRSRWWSGESWTDHVQSAAVAIAPEPAPVVVAVAEPVEVPPMPVAVVAPVAPAASVPNLDANGVPLNLFADASGGFDPAVLAPQAGPSSQSDWHTNSGRGPRPTRAASGSVSLSTQVASATSRKHDPYRERNWVAGVALVLAILSAPALVLSVGWDLPAITRGIFGGAPIALSLLAVASSIRKGSGVVVSIVATLIAGGVLLAGFFVDPQIFRDLISTVAGMVGL